MSRPLIEGHDRITVEVKKGDERRWFQPCPKCGHFQNHNFKRHFKFKKDEKGGYIDGSAYIECEACRYAITYAENVIMLSKGEWRKTNSYAHKGVASFYWLGLNTPFMSFGVIAQKFCEAMTVLNAFGDSSKLQTFFNAYIGESWAAADNRPKWERIALRNEGEEFYLTQHRIEFLTMGVDVGKYDLTYEITGWGANKESWSIEAGKLKGVTEDLNASCWSDLKKKLIHGALVNGSMMPVKICLIDTGYNHAAVYFFCNEFSHGVYGVDGITALKGKLFDKVSVPDFNTIKFNVDITRLKGEVYGDIVKIIHDGEASLGYCHFPSNREKNYYRELTAETPVLVNRHGRKVYCYENISGAPNHHLDARVYATAGFYIYAASFFETYFGVSVIDWRRFWQEHAKYEAQPVLPFN
jgi:phage terminase large subunit GpA-like protein